MRAVAAVAVLTLSGCQALAYRSAVRTMEVAPPPMDHGLDAQVLPSGLRLAVFQLPGQRGVTVSLALGGGEADEPEGKEGVARVALRAALQAPRGQGGLSLQERLYAAGALVGAVVSQDETGVAVRCRPAFQGEVVAALADLLDDPAAGIEDDLVAQVREELAGTLEREADGGQAATREAVRLALDGTVFGHPAPSPERVRALSAGDVRAFLRASYAPARAVLWLATARVAEDEAREVVAALRGRAGGDPAHPVPPEAGFSSVPPPGRAPVRQVALTGGARPRLLLAWRSTGLRFQPAANAAGIVLREALGRRAARRDLTDLVTHVSVSLQVLDRAGVLLIEVGLERLEDAGKVSEALVAAIPDALPLWAFRSRQIDGDWRRELRLERELELAEGWVGPVGRLVRAVGATDVPGWLDLNERAQVSNAVTGWLDAWVLPGPAVIATVAPTPDAVATSPAERAAPEERSAQPAGRLTWPTARSLVAAATPGVDQLDRLLEPGGLGAARRVTLPNGLELVVLPRPGAPFVTLLLHLPGGAIRVSEGLAARRALDTARAGLRRDGCGLAPKAFPYADGVLVGLTGPASWLPALVEGTACWGRSLPAPPQRAPSPDETMPWLAFEAALTSGPLPARPGGWSWAEVYLDRLANPAGAVAVLAGDVEPEAALRQLRAAFGRFSPRGEAAAPRPAAPARPAVRRVLVRDVPKARQASATVLLRLPDGLPVTSAPRAVLDNLLSDWAERTFEPSGLEVEHGSATAGGADFLSLTLSGPAALVHAAAAEVLAEFRRLAERGPSAIAAGSARWDAARAIAYRDGAPRGAAGALLALAVSGQRLDGWDRFARDLRDVDAAAVQALVQGSAVGVESLLFSGDAATLVPLLTGQGLAPEVLAPPARGTGGAAR